MCGIAGAVWTDPTRVIDPEVLRRMVAALAHRGPDADGFYTDPNAALGHRRLAIIDVACGAQPMANEDDSVWVVFNGEIYNHHELRGELEGRGHRFRTHSDTEVLVHLYEDQGEEAIARLNGMFALAIWDQRQRRLLLARDRMGEKPLVYRHEPGRLLFASELKALLAVPGLPRRIDPAALDAYLAYQYVPHPRIIFEGYQKLPPGHLAVYADDRLEVRRYWSPDLQSEVDRPAEEYAQELRELLTSAVAMRLESEVPLGAFLSGGIDSSIIVGLMSKQMDRPVRTFSIGFPVRQYDETHYARLVARRHGTLHEEFRVEPDAIESLPKLVWHYDEPFADSSALPTWYLSQLTRRHVTVALTGDGGDELFAGYDRYRAVRLAAGLDRLGPLRRLLAARFWQRLPASPRQKSLLRRIKRFSQSLAMPPARRYFEWISIFGQARRAALYSESFLAALPEGDPLDFLASHAALAAGRDPVTRFSLADALTYLPGDLMTKVDIAAMAHGLETRPPFLDHRVVELAARMPVRLKFRGGKGKRILLDTFADLLPPEIQTRKKMGFGVPLDHWFRGPLAEFTRSVLLDRRTLDRGLFREEAVRELVESHLAGRFDHSARLWSLLVLEMWQRTWL